MRALDVRLLKAADDAVAFVWAETGLRYPVQLLLLQVLGALSLVVHLTVHGQADAPFHLAMYWLGTSLMRWGRLWAGDDFHRWFRERLPGILIRFGFLFDVFWRAALYALAGSYLDAALVTVFLGFWFLYWGIPPKKRPPKKEREALYQLGLQGTA